MRFSTRAAALGGGLALALGAVLTSSEAQAGPLPAVHFIAGTYQLSDTYRGAPVDTLQVSVTAGEASFSLSGADSETFSLPDDNAPLSVNGFGDVVYPMGLPITPASWNTSAYPFLELYSKADQGGLEIQGLCGGCTLINLYRSNVGSGTVYTLVPEPATWTMLILGVAGVGFAMRRRATAGSAAV